MFLGAMAIRNHPEKLVFMRVVEVLQVRQLSVGIAMTGERRLHELVRLSY